jgi:isocitrate/isopropylmalate dehydrogenase
VKILLIPGDGVGSELAAELQKLISAVQSLFELKISTQTLDISELHFRDTNILVPKAFNKMAREADTIWLGPILNQSNLKGYTRKNIIQQICSMQGFEFYYRHFNPLPSLQKIQTDNPIDILLIENNFYSHNKSKFFSANNINTKNLSLIRSS